jgi:hypothetical protein
MSIKYKDESKTAYLAFLVPTAKAINDSWTPDDLITKVSDSYIASPSGLSVIYQLPVSELSVESYRENTPFDSPPGVGYKAKRLTGEYISQKNHEKIFDFKNIKGYCIPFNTSSPWVSYWLPSLSYPDVGLSVSTETHFDTSAHNQAVRNLYAGLRKRQKFNTGVFLAELKESVGLIGESAIAIFKIISALKKGRVSDALKVIRNYAGGDSSRRLENRSQLNARRRKKRQKPISKSDYASNMWLELQFGWLPILSDIHDLIELVSEGLTDDKEKVFSVSGYGNADYGYESTPRVEDFDYSHGIYSPEIARCHYQNRTIISKGKGNTRIGYTYTYKCSNSKLDFLNQLGLINPLSVAWEIVPLSFVADWFLPIGNWLNSLTADAGLEILDSSRQLKKSYVGKFTNVPKVYVEYYGAFAPALIPEFTESFSRETFQRTVTLDGSSLPTFPVGPVAMADILQPWKLITASALINALFGGRH